MYRLIGALSEPYPPGPKAIRHYSAAGVDSGAYDLTPANKSSKHVKTSPLAMISYAKLCAYNLELNIT